MNHSTWALWSGECCPSWMVSDQRKRQLSQIIWRFLKELLGCSAFEWKNHSLRPFASKGLKQWAIGLDTTLSFDALQIPISHHHYATKSKIMSHCVGSWWLRNKGYRFLSIHHNFSPITFCGFLVPIPKATTWNDYLQKLARVHSCHSRGNRTNCQSMFSIVYLMFCQECGYPSR